MSVYDLDDDVRNAAGDIRECEAIIGRSVVMSVYLKEEGDAAGHVEALVFGGRAVVRYHELQEEYIKALNIWLDECRYLGYCQSACRD